MPTRPSETKARTMRRWVFWTWVAVTVAVAAVVADAAPVAVILDMSRTWEAVFVPPAIILLSSIGFIWFVLYVLLAPPRDGSHTGEMAPRPQR